MPMHPETPATPSMNLLARPTLALAAALALTGACASAGARGAQVAPSLFDAGDVATANIAESSGPAGGVAEDEYRTRLAQADPAPAPIAAGPPRSEPARPLAPKMVVEGWLELEVDHVATAAADIRAWVEDAGGRVDQEQITGSEESWYGNLQLKVPPERVDAFLAWAEEHHDITSKRVKGTDVSRTLFDQQLALDNLTLTLERLRQLLDRQGLVMKDILDIEKEMTRLRGEIERIRGEKRFLEHRVALATLTVQLRRREGRLRRASAKFYPGARLASLVLLTADGRERLGHGGGVAVYIVPQVNLELSYFDGPGDESRALLATLGVSAYSDFLGRGKRRFLNPYLGVRAGYGYLDRGAFAFAVGGGVELYKHPYVLLDANLRAVGLAHDDGLDAAVVGGLNAAFAF